MKRILSLCLALSMVISLFSGVMVSASVDNEKLGWELSDIYLHHDMVLFTIDNVEAAQDAVLYIEDEGNIISCPFSISSSQEKFELDFPDGVSLPTGQYRLWVEDQDGRSTTTWLARVPKHSFYVHDTKAYPNCVTGTAHRWQENISIIYAEVGFQKYVAERDEDDSFVISYPVQKIGTIVKVYAEDGYGCQEIDTVVVQNKKVELPWSMEVFRNGIASYHTMEPDERLCVDIDGKVYYGSYGAGGDYYTYDWLVSYPAVPREVTKLTVWVESSVGSISEKQDYIIQDCKFSEFDISMDAYPGKATGTVKANSYGQMPNDVSITLGGKVYSAVISSDGNFELTYPIQQGNGDLNFLFYDSHGCSLEERKYIHNPLGIFGGGYVCLIVPNRTMAVNVEEGNRLYVNVGGKEYKSELSTKKNEGTVTVRYPVQKVGTKITAWIQNDVTTECTTKKSYAVEEKKYSYYCLAKTDQISGYLYFDEADNDSVWLESNITSVSVLIDGKEYPCKLKEMDASDLSEEKLDEMDDIMDDETLIHFSCSYPKQKIGRKIQLLIRDADGYSFTYNEVLENLPPKIKMNPVYSSDSKISGITTAGSDVTIKFGKKTYQTKAKKDGKFSVKVKSQKVGTKIKVSVVSPQGYRNSEILTVKLDDSDVTIKGNVYRTSSSITLSLYKPKKGDRLTVKVSGRKYTRKVKAGKKGRKIVIKLERKPVAGSKISVVLKDKFGKKKVSFKEMVYYSNSIVKGMSAKNATLTTWGYPIRRNDYGTGTLQWVYQSGRTYLYVYIKGGKVVAIQRIDY